MEPVNHHLRTDWIIHTLNAVSHFLLSSCQKLDFFLNETVYWSVIPLMKVF